MIFSPFFVLCFHLLNMPFLLSLMGLWGKGRSNWRCFWSLSKLDLQTSLTIWRQSSDSYKVKYIKALSMDRTSTDITFISKSVFSSFVKFNQWNGFLCILFVCLMLMPDTHILLCLSWNFTNNKYVYFHPSHRAVLPVPVQM